MTGNDFLYFLCPIHYDMTH